MIGIGKLWKNSKLGLEEEGGIRVWGNPGQGQRDPLLLLGRAGKQ